MDTPFAFPSSKAFTKSLNRLNQHINKAETQKRIVMDQLEHTSQGLRRTRTHQFIQLGTLIEKTGLLETFEITLGADLQKAPEITMPLAALFKGLLDLNEMAKSDDAHLMLWAQQGLDVLHKRKHTKRT